MPLYVGGSFIFVPPSFTKSAVTPSFFPSSFTFSINAGGKLNSRPHSKPTFAMAPPLGCPTLDGWLFSFFLQLRASATASPERSRRVLNRSHVTVAGLLTDL